MPKTVIVRCETHADISAAGDIVRQAFGREEEALLLAALRKTADFSPKLSLVAEIEPGRALGYALFLQITCSGSQTPIPSAHLHPVAVLPRYQKQGIGERLVRSGLEHCRALNIELVFATEAPEFFSRFGFQPARPLNFDTELAVTDKAFQVLDLNGELLGSTKGKVTFSRPFLEPLED